MFSEIGKGILQSAWNSMENMRINAELEQLNIPTLEVTPILLESLSGSFGRRLVLPNLFEAIESGTYSAIPKQLVVDVLATIFYCYSDKDWVGNEQDLEKLTSIVLDNWHYLGDKEKSEAWKFAVDGIYKATKIREITHTNGEPALTYKFKVLIILDFIKRLGKPPSYQGEVVMEDKKYLMNFGYQYEEFDDEINHLREKLKEPRKSWERGQYDWSKDKDSCWIVTAYYGYEVHPNVCTIRDFRENLITYSLFGNFVTRSNKLYQQVGRSRFGYWWRQQVQKKPFSIPGLASRLICTVLLFVANIYNASVDK